MKQYLIKEKFNGSQDGRFVETFNKGDTVELSDSLAEVAVREGWAELAGEPSGQIFEARNIGGGKWEVHGPDGVVAEGLNKKDAAAKAAELNAAGNEAE